MPVEGLVPRPRPRRGPRFYTRHARLRRDRIADEGWVAARPRRRWRSAIAEGEPSEDGGVATIDVADVKAEAERLRGAGVEVGVVLELHGQMRLLDVFDPDGNRIQLAQVLDDRARAARRGRPSSEASASPRRRAGTDAHW